jgi:hypothetical protein
MSNLKEIHEALNIFIEYSEDPNHDENELEKKSEKILELINACDDKEVAKKLLEVIQEDEEQTASAFGAKSILIKGAAKGAAWCVRNAPPYPKGTGPILV